MTSAHALPLSTQLRFPLPSESNGTARLFSAPRPQDAAVRKAGRGVERAFCTTLRLPVLELIDHCAHPPPPPAFHPQPWRQPANHSSSPPVRHEANPRT